MMFALMAGMAWANLSIALAFCAKMLAPALRRPALVWRRPEAILPLDLSTAALNSIGSGMGRSGTGISITLPGPLLKLKPSNAPYEGIAGAPYDGKGSLLYEGAGAGAGAL